MSIVNGIGRSWQHVQRGECRRLATELRRGTWQVRQVRQQQHAGTTKRCSDLVSWRNKSSRRGNQYQWQLQQTNRNMFLFNRHAAREHLPYLCTFAEDHMRHAMLVDLVKGFFFRRRARYQHCLACTASLVAATRDFRTARQSSCVL